MQFSRYIARNFYTFIFLFRHFLQFTRIGAIWVGYLYLGTNVDSTCQSRRNEQKSSSTTICFRTRLLDKSFDINHLYKHMLRAIWLINENSRNTQKEDFSKVQIATSFLLVSTSGSVNTRALRSNKTSFRIGKIYSRFIRWSTTSLFSRYLSRYPVTFCGGYRHR